MLISSSRQIPAPQTVEWMLWVSLLKSGHTLILKSCAAFQTCPSPLLRQIQKSPFLVFGIPQDCNKSPVLLPTAPLAFHPRNPNPALQTRLQGKRSSASNLFDLKQNNFLPMLLPDDQEVKMFSLHFTQYLKLRWDLGWSHYRKDASREKKKS